MPVLSDEEKEYCKEVFKSVDADGSGAIDAKELHAALTKVATEQKWDKVPTEEQVAARLASMPTEKEGELSLPEYIFMVAGVKVMTFCAVLFDEFDKDGSGDISADELKEVVTKIHANNGLPPPDDDLINEVVKEIGGDDMKVDFEEFCAFMIPRIVDAALSE